MLTDAQLEMRKTGLGGSDIAAALGLSPWTTQAALWADKMGQKPPVQENEAMEWGSRHEGTIFTKFVENNSYLRCTHSNSTVRHDEYPFLLATPDGFIVDENNKAGILEIKTSSDFPWDEPPIFYQLQLQHYMYVMGRTYGYFAVLFRGHQYREYGPYNLDVEGYEQVVMPKLIEFWDSVESERCKFSPTTIEELGWIGVEIDAGVEMETTDELDRLHRYRQQCVEDIKESTADKAETEIKIAELMDGAKKLVNAEGKSLVIQIQTKDTTVLDAKRLKDEQPDIFEAYQKERRGFRSMRFYSHD